MNLNKLANLGADGQTWYTDAQVFLKKLCQENGWPYREFANVLAITSQRAHLKRNLRLTMLVMRGTKIKTLPAVQTALIHYRKTGIIRGLKTSAFARALQGDKNAVVIDIWMSRALKSDFLPDTSRRYAVLANKILRAARNAGMPPSEFQAAVWCATLKLNNRKATSYRDVFETL